MYRHILFLEFKKDADEARQRYLAGLKRLEEIPGVLSVEHGPNVNPRSSADYVVIISLESEQQRTNYLGTGRPLNNHYDLGVAYLF